MFKLFNTFLGALLLLILLRWLLPPEVGELASQILIKVLTLINDLVANLP